MLTFTGIHITREFGAPSIRDMSVQGMRIGRFAGAWERWFWPIGMHSLLVADLLPEPLKHHGLLHDVASEVSMSDIPRPMKTDEQKTLEKNLAARTYDFLGIDLPTAEEAELIHEADVKAGHAEGISGCGPRGYRDTTTVHSVDQYAVSLLLGYLKDLGNNYYAEIMNSDGYWPIHFERRIRESIRQVQSEVTYHKAA